MDAITCTRVRFSGVGEIEPDEMSFEGMFVDLLYTHRDGVNTNGMYARTAEQFTSGASVHYLGVNDMYRHWLARPDKYVHFPLYYMEQHK